MSEAARDALREQLKPNIEHIAAQAEARRLLRALSLAEGFSLQIAVCNSTRGATALQLWLELAVAEARGEPVAVERISPYPLDWRAPGPGPLEGEGLAELVVPRLVGRAGEGGRLVFVDAARSRPGDAEAWRALLLRLNERRNRIVAELGAPLTLILPPTLEVDFARLAPDMWSIRSLVAQVDDRDQATGLLRAFDAGFDPGPAHPEIGPERAALVVEVERLREQARGGSPASARALRVALMRLAGVDMRRGAYAEGETLVEEARAIAERLGEPAAIASAELALADFSRLRGELARAQGLAEAALERLKDGDDEWALADAWGRLADVLERRGEFDEVLRIRRERELPTYERLHDERAAAGAWTKIADVLYAVGRLGEALGIWRERALPVYEKLGDARACAVVRGGIAGALMVRGQLDEALEILRGQLSVFERLGDRRERAISMGMIADILQQRGEFDEAVRIFRDEQLAVFQALGAHREAALTQVNLAITLSRRARPEDREEVRTLLASALAELREMGARGNVQWAEDVIRQLGEDPEQPPFSGS